MRNDCFVLGQILKSAGFSPKQFPHCERVPTTAMSWEVPQETSRTKLAVTWLNGRKIKALRTSDAGSVVIVGEVHCPSELEKSSFEPWAQQTVSIDNVGTPVLDAL